MHDFLQLVDKIGPTRGGVHIFLHKIVEWKRIEVSRSEEIVATRPSHFWDWEWHGSSGILPVMIESRRCYGLLAWHPQCLHLWNISSRVGPRLYRVKKILGWARGPCCFWRILCATDKTEPKCSAQPQLKFSGCVRFHQVAVDAVSLHRKLSENQAFNQLRSSISTTISLTDTSH